MNGATTLKRETNGCCPSRRHLGYCVHTDMAHRQNAFNKRSLGICFLFWTKVMLFLITILTRYFSEFTLWQVTALRAKETPSVLQQNVESSPLCRASKDCINLMAPELFFLILAHPVYKMWIIQEPNTLELWNKLHFEEKKTENIYHV